MRFGNKDDSEDGDEAEEEVCPGAAFFKCQAATSGGCVTGSCLVLMIQ